MTTTANLYQGSRFIASTSWEENPRSRTAIHNKKIIFPQDTSPKNSFSDPTLKTTEKIMVSCYTHKCQHFRSNKPLHFHLLGHLTHITDTTSRDPVSFQKYIIDLTETPIDLRNITSPTFPLRAFKYGEPINNQSVPTSVRKDLDNEKMLLFLSSSFLFITCYGKCGGGATDDDPHLHTYCDITAITQVSVQDKPLPTNEEIRNKPKIHTTGHAQNTLLKQTLAMVVIALLAWIVSINIE